jgi:hypothetical protein
MLGMRQGDLSKLERRADAYLSTIRRYVEAMGGRLARASCEINLSKREELLAISQTATRIPLFCNRSAIPDKVLGVGNAAASSFHNFDAPAQPIVRKLAILARTT